LVRESEMVLVSVDRERLFALPPDVVTIEY